MRKITIDLNVNDIDAAISELEDYRDEIIEKIGDFVDALTQGGVEVASMKVAASQGDSNNVSVDRYYADTEGNIVKAVICLNGTDCLFVEFGAGLYYNNGNAHPYASQFGYGVGTYPSKHPPNRAINPAYWWYRGQDGALHFSRGTEATMPLYSAAESMRNDVIVKAAEIFKS